MKSAWNGKNKILSSFCLICTMLLPLSGCDDAPSRPGKGFYSYQGFRDWWRIPLRFPYQITMIDSMKSGILEKFDPSSPVDAPKCETLATEVTAVGYDGKFAAFKQDGDTTAFGILCYDSGSVKKFETEEALADFIRKNYPATSPPELVKLDKFYELMWRAIDKIKRTDPRKLVY